MNVYTFLALYTLIFATTTTSAAGRGSAVSQKLRFLQGLSKNRKEDPDAPQGRNPRNWLSQDPSRSVVVARNYLRRHKISTKTTKSPVQLQKEKEAAKMKRNPKGISILEKKMQEFDKTLRKVAMKAGAVRCKTNEPDCPRNHCCMKAKGQEYGTCQRYPGHLGQCTAMCTCNSHSSQPKMECKTNKKENSFGGVFYRHECLYVTEPEAADITSLRRIGNAKMSGKKPRKRPQVPLLDRKVKANVKSKTTV